MASSQKIAVAALLRRFLDGTAEEWEFDDFISIPSDDPDIERIRRLVNCVSAQFPPLMESAYANEEGLSEIARLADELVSGVG